MVTGSRLAEGANVASASRCRAGSSGGRSCSSAGSCCASRRRDLFCGFKLWRAEAADATYGRIHLEGWVYDAELFAMARALGYRIRETGIVWIDREGSRLSMRALLFPSVRDLLAAPAPRARGPAERRPSRPARGRRPAVVEPPARRSTGSSRRARRAARRCRSRCWPGCSCGCWTKGGDRHRVRRLPGRRPAAVPELAAPGGRARAAGNLYDLAPGPRSFVHPGVLISGLLHALGLPA